jgi:hypothetical protein
MTHLILSPRPAWTIQLLPVFLLLGPLAAADFQGSTHLMPYDEDAIGYGRTAATNSITRLQAAIESGASAMKFDPTFGYLPTVLDALRIPQASQMLVFSKTSFQRERISPSSPRALYFNDDVYVGYVPGSHLLEISVADPRLGGVFYTLEQKEVPRPRFVRTDGCLECHASAKSMGVPGHLVRSFATDEIGVVDLNSGTSQVNHRTPFAERWGGWYVTGQHGVQAHRGNLFGQPAFERAAREPNFAGNLKDLGRYFDQQRYPLQGSDIVALMLLEHQSHMHNFITRLNYEATIALRQYGHVRYLKTAVNAFLKYLLFTEEAPLTAKVAGNPAYAAWFESQGPKDRQGRSLHQLDLQARLLRYPCSYLIYSEAFDALPQELRDVLYQRLWDILSGKDDSADFKPLGPESRRAILEILQQTKTGLPDYWRPNEPQ